MGKIIVIENKGRRIVFRKNTNREIGLIKDFVIGNMICIVVDLIFRQDVLAWINFIASLLCYLEYRNMKSENDIYDFLLEIAESNEEE